jgi:hypothetical protein
MHPIIPVVGIGETVDSVVLQSEIYLFASDAANPEIIPVGIGSKGDVNGVDGIKSAVDEVGEMFNRITRGDNYFYGIEKLYFSKVSALEIGIESDL